MKRKLTVILFFLTLYTVGQINGYEKIKELYDNGRQQDAINLSKDELKKLKPSDPEYREIIRLRVDCYMETANFSSAITDWDILINISPRDKSLYEGIAYAYWANNDLQQCLNNIDKAYAISPNDPMVLSNMSYYYGEAGKYKESIYYATTGLEQKNIQTNDEATLLNNRGFAYLQIKQTNKALEDINKSITLNPNNSFAYWYRAMANIDLNKMETVCADLEKAKSLGGINMTKDLISQYCN